MAEHDSANALTPDELNGSSPPHDNNEFSLFLSLVYIVTGILVWLVIYNTSQSTIGE